MQIKTIMKELSVQTSSFIEDTLKELQASKASQHIVHREPQTWMLVARHCMEGTTRVTDFRKEHGILQKLYYAIRNDLIHKDDFDSLRMQWGREFGALVEAQRDLQWQMIESVSQRIHDKELFPEIKDLAPASRATQGSFDTFQKATGGNVQKIVVEHKTTLSEAEDYARKMIEEMQEAEIVEE